jgi:hypothetical protein
MRIRFFFLALLLMSCGFATAHADTYSLQLTGDWLRPYIATGYWHAPVDFGVRFSSIQSVSISWSGTVTTGYDDFLLPVRGYFESMFIVAPNSVMAYASSPRSPQSYSFPTGSFDTQTTLNANTWEFLLDGAADLRIAYAAENNDYTVGGTPWGNLSSASLTVTGTAVPEPASLLPMAVGLVSLAATVRRRRR